MEITPPRLFPFCIVWTPIPLVTWILPFVGHLGICRADGTILDFLGDCHVQVGDFGFGAPTRYLPLEPSRNGTWSYSSGRTLSEWWNEELNDAAMFFRTLHYNFCGTNCHSFVSFFLNSIDYESSMKWNSLNLGILMFFKSRFVGFVPLLKTFLPFVAIIVVGLYFGRITFLFIYLALAIFSLMYFFLYEYCCAAQLKLRDLRSLS